jgi:hypothetical protein
MQPKCRSGLAEGDAPLGGGGAPARVPVASAAMPPLPTASEMPELQLRAVQAEIAQLRLQLGVATLEPASPPPAEPASPAVGDLSAELSRRLAGLESPQAPAPQQGLRTRLKSYADGEYGAALRVAPATETITFAQDTNPAPSATGVGSSLGRLKSYSAHEYSGVLAEAEPEPEVNFAASAVAAAQQGKRLGRLKSYGAGEYAGVLQQREETAADRSIRATAPAFVPGQQPAGLSKMQEVAMRRQQQQQQQQQRQMQQMLAHLHQQQKPPTAAPSASVSFESDAAAGPAQVSTTKRLGRLKSYGAGEYAGVLKPRGHDDTPVKHRKVCNTRTPLPHVLPSRSGVREGVRPCTKHNARVRVVAQVVRTLTPHGIHDMVEVRTIPGNDRSRRGSIGEEQQAASDELAAVLEESESLRSHLQLDGPDESSPQAMGAAGSTESLLRRRQPTPRYAPGGRVINSA